RPAPLLVNRSGCPPLRAPTAPSSGPRGGGCVTGGWLPRNPNFFPLLYVTAAVVALALLIAKDKRANLWRYAIFVMLLILAIRHVRYQGLYFATLPMLVPPVRFKHVAFAAAALVPIGWAFAHDTHRLGVDDERFPLHAV